MSSFRRAVRLRNRNLRTYKKGLRRQAGVKGVDNKGAQLDRRGYHEIKQTLDNLYYQQLALYRNYGKTYKNDPLLLNSLTFSQEPVFDTYHVTVRKDSKAWMAWQQATNGWHLGIGGTSRMEEKWVYTGPTLPTTFPSLKTQGWYNTATTPTPPDWKRSDDPPSYVEEPELAG